MAKRLKVVRRSDLKRVVVVGSTAQEKGVAYPTDSRLLEVVCQKVGEAATQEGVSLRQRLRADGPEAGDPSVTLRVCEAAQTDA